LAVVLKSDLVRQVAELVASMQETTQAVDEAAADYLGVNLTDLRCLALVSRTPMTLGELAVATGRTPAAMTAAIDRLQRAGLAERVPDSGDRRRILVRPSELAWGEIEAIWGPIADEGAAELAKYTNQQLRFLLEFLREAIRVQENHSARLRKGVRAHL
jgi:DNA-binding MarR family transcriptional regulator